MQQVRRLLAEMRDEETALLQDRLRRLGWAAAPPQASAAELPAP